MHREMNREKMKWFLLSVICFGCLSIVHAELTAKVESSQQVGKKAVIKLNLKNNFSEKIESARAQVFLLDEQGKVLSQKAQWVIGGTKDRPALEPGKESVFNFVVETDKPFTKTRVGFSRIVLEGGKVVDPQRNSTVTP